MATLAPPSPPSSPSSRPRRRWARKVERCCCTALSFFPLPCVYGLTSWAVWVETDIGLLPNRPTFAGPGMAAVGVILFVLLNWSYTVAVFTDPGSPLSAKSGYSHLPTQEPRTNTFTVKSTGDSRFCKKCQAKKPDRAHHCSTCRRCVLKMDHHCPWLATCLGLRNYKSFVLFLAYTTVFCWVCFVLSGSWMWGEVLVDAQYNDTLMPVNYVLLTVLSGIIGLVLTGFTAWHLMLALRNQTTIECLEKTRYLSPLRKTLRNESHRLGNGNPTNDPSYRQQFLDIHTNTLPGVTRPEEGTERQSPIPNQTNFQEPSHGNWNHYQRDYNAYEQARQRDRYEEYLDEKDSESLPNAFDLGWKRNLTHLFGAKPLYWLLPVCNTSGDGWNWEASPSWLQARDEIRREREDQRRRDREQFNSRHYVDPYAPNDESSNYQHQIPSPTRAPQRPSSGRRSPFKADQILGRRPDQFADDPALPASDNYGSDGVSLQTLRGRHASEDEEEDPYDVSSDEEEADHRRLLKPLSASNGPSGSVSPAWRGDKGATKSS